MRPDQLARLTDLRDRLVETALVDADPANWTAAGKIPAEMSQQERGDAKWCRGLAVSTVALAIQVQRMMDGPAPAGDPSGDEGEEIDRRIRAAEERATTAVQQAITNAKERASGGRAAAKRAG